AGPMNKLGVSRHHRRQPFHSTNGILNGGRANNPGDSCAAVQFAGAKLAEGDERIILSEFTDYDEMLAGVRARVSALNITGEGCELFAGLPKGYLSKLIGVNPTRRIGMTSMGPLFGALGMRGQFVEDQAATERLKSRVAPRNGSYVRAAPSIVLT